MKIYLIIAGILASIAVFFFIIELPIGVTVNLPDKAITALEIRNEIDKEQATYFLVNGRYKQLGMFNDLNDARKSRLQAEKKYWNKHV